MATSQDRSQALLDACTLDNAALKDKTAAKVIVHARPPRVVIKPVLRHTLHLLRARSANGAGQPNLPIKRLQIPSQTESHNHFLCCM